jgi:flagellar biosynthesis protein FliR
MPTVLADLAALQIYGALLVFSRVGAAFMLIPGLGETYLPARLRLCAAFLVALAMTGAVLDQLPALPAHPAVAAGQIGAEIMVGLLLGTMARLLFMALQVAGTIVAQQAGLGLLVPAAVVPEGMAALGQVLLFGGISLVFAFNLDHQLLLAIRDSYGPFPLGELPDPADMAMHVTETVGVAFALGVRLALPFLVVGFTMYAGLGVINRAMPQLMVLFVAAPALTMIGLVLLAIIVPTLLLAWAAAFDSGMFGR